MFRRQLLTIATTACLLGGAVHAAPIAVTNHNFEQDNANDGQILTSANGATGWTFTSTGAQLPGSFNPNGTTQLHYGPDAADGGGSGGVIGTMDGPSLGFHFLSDGVTGESAQTLAATLQANTNYTLTVAIGTRFYFNAGQVPADFRIALETTGGHVVAQFIGDVINANPGTPGENSTGVIALTPGTVFDYVAAGSTGAAPAGLGEQLVIKIQSLADGRYLDFDNFRLDATAIPEPASLALVGMGALLILRRRD